MRNIPIIIITAFLVLLAKESGSTAAGPVVIDGKTESYALGTYLEILEDKDKKWTIDHVTAPELSRQFIRSDKEIPSFGISGSAFWVRFTVAVKQAVPFHWKLELEFPLIDYVDLYSPALGGEKNSLTRYRVKKKGYAYPFSQRGNGYSNIVFDINLRQGDHKTYYARIESFDRTELGLFLQTEAALEEKNQNRMYLLGMYFGLAVVIMILNLIMFFTIRDPSYLYYVLFVASAGLYLFTQNGLTYKYLVPESFWEFKNHVFYIIIACFFWGMQFSKSFLNIKKHTPRLHKLIRISQAIFASYLILPFLASFSLSIIIIVVSGMPVVLLLLVSGFVILLKKYGPAKYFMAAWGILVSAAIITGLKNLGFIPANFFTIYSLHIGSSIELIILTIGLGARIQIMKQEKELAQVQVIETQEKMVEQLVYSNLEIEEANRKIGLSEEKYRLLVENTKDVIFSLDEEWHFISANRALWNFFGIDPEKVSSLHFRDLLFVGDKDTSIARQFVLEKLGYFFEENKRLQFKAEFKSPISTEPREMMVYLEPVIVEGKNEILGKLSTEVEDSLMKNIEFEKQVIRISNYLVAAEDISYRVTSNLGKYIDQSKATFLRIALREILINAIEHGNLNISFEEKSRVMAAENYFQFVGKKQNDPRYRDRRVQIEYTIGPQLAAYIITDEGDGFDHKKVMEGIVKEGPGMLSHGRGLCMALKEFDEISYNEKGNRVTLVKYFED
ncbi:MAG: PAS domain S-box protein [bacterium]|nr:PAS domain S-box protein [bacterium]